MGCGREGRGQAGTRETGSGGGNGALWACGQALPLAFGASCAQVGWMRRRDGIYLLCLSFSCLVLPQLVFSSSSSQLSSLPGLSFPLCLPTVSVSSLSVTPAVSPLSLCLPVLCWSPPCRSPPSISSSWPAVNPGDWHQRDLLGTDPQPRAPTELSRSLAAP